MRILHLIQRYWPAVGGAEQHLHQLSARLAKDGHEVTVATTDALDVELFWHRGKRRIPQRQDYHDDVRILRFPVRHLPFTQASYPAWRRLLWALSWFSPTPVNVLDWLAQVTPFVPSLWRWLGETDEQFDLVAAMTICFEPILSAGLHFARQRRVPFVSYPLTHLGAGPEPGVDELSRFYTMRHQVATVLHSDAVVTQTGAERDYYLARGLSPARTVVGGPGISTESILGGNGEKFRRQHRIEAPIVAAIGTMSRDKGTIQTVEAVRRLWSLGYSVELILAGSLLSTFQDYLHHLPGQERNRIQLLGPVDEQTKRDLLAATDVLVMPSRTDSFGISYLEAWSYGKPVIGARVWGVDQVIDHEVDGLLVPFGDYPALARSLATLLDDPARRAEMGRRGKLKVGQHHTWSDKYQVTAELYRRLTTSERP